MTGRPPTPTQAWLRHERRSLGLSIRAAAQQFGTSRSVLHRAERGGPNGSKDDGAPVLLDRVAATAAVELGSWPAPDPATVSEILRWWRQHPIDRLARCLQARRGDWQTPIRHVTRQLLPLPATVAGASALDLLLPPEGRDPPTEWTLLCPWVAEPCRLYHRYLGILQVGRSQLRDRALAIPDGLGRNRPNNLRIMEPRELITALGWSPLLAAAVQAADLGGDASGVGYARRQLRPHRSLEIYEEFDDDEWDPADLGELVQTGYDLGEDVRVGLGEHAVT